MNNRKNEVLKSEILSLRVTPGEKKRLKELANKNRRSVSQQVSWMLEKSEVLKRVIEEV